MGDEETTRLYGPWRPRGPRDAADLMRGYPGRWWIAGGWAIEAFTGVSRPHADLDLSIPRSDVPLLRHHLTGRLDVWAAESGALRPVLDDDPLPTTYGNLWLRPSGAEPWEYDVLLMSTTATLWTYKRDPRLTRPLDDILWTHNGLTYLRPEVQLLHKAPGRRPQDQADLDFCLPLLDQASRSWLSHALATAHPGHAWLALL